MNNWYVLGDAARNDINLGAEKSAGRTGKTQAVHEHADGEPCVKTGPFVCRLVEPGDWPPGQESARAAMRNRP